VFSSVKGAYKAFYSTLYSIKLGGKQQSILLDRFTRSRQQTLLDPPTRSSTRPVYSIMGNLLYKTCWSFKVSSDPPHSPLNQTSEHKNRRGRSNYSTNWSLGAWTQRRILCNTLFTRSPRSSTRPNRFKSLVF